MRLSSRGHGHGVDRSVAAQVCTESGGPRRAPGLWGLTPSVEIRGGFPGEEPFEIGCQGKEISLRTQGQVRLTRAWQR